MSTVRSAAVVAGAALVLLVLSACGAKGADTPTAQEKPTPSPTSPVTEATASPTPQPEPTPSPGSIQEPAVAKRTEGPPAPEFTGITGWINTEPLSLAGLRGKVVLIDFWTYTCVNCIRTFPFLRQWYEKYADEGLVIVGIHSPEFEFERNRANVEAAMREHDITWPVAQDNDYGTWDAYDNLYWPAKYLIDKDGIIRYQHFGEGAYDEVEQQIRALLKETGVSVSHIPAGSDPGPAPDPRASVGPETGQTRELYAGYIRNRVARFPYITNAEHAFAQPDVPNYFDDLGEHANHFLYLHGMWTIGPESVLHARETKNLEDYIALKFFGTSVNAVVGFEGGEPFQVVVELDGSPLPEDHRGADIRVDGKGQTFFLVDQPRMYGLIELPEYGGHELKLSSNSDRFSLFALTFGSYAEGP